MKRCVFTPIAQKDLEVIHDFIALHHPSTALHFIDFLEEKCLLLVETPTIGRLREELAVNLRYFPVKNYNIFYREIDEGIEIIRILHGSRNIGVF